MSGRISNSIDRSPSRPEAPRDALFIDRRTTFAAVLALTMAVLLLAMWASTPTSYEQCAAITDYQTRIDCFERVRDQQLQPPAKGPKVPINAIHD